MTEVVPIYEAKTNLSRLVKRANAGETIYIGAYGHAEAILAPVPARKPIRLGALAHLRDPDFDYGAEDLVGPDREAWEGFFAEMDRDEASD